MEPPQGLGERVKTPVKFSDVWELHKTESLPKRRGRDRKGKGWTHSPRRHFPDCVLILGMYRFINWEIGFSVYVCVHMNLCHVCMYAYVVCVHVCCMHVYIHVYMLHACVYACVCCMHMCVECMCVYICIVWRCMHVYRCVCYMHVCWMHVCTCVVYACMFGYECVYVCHCMYACVLYACVWCVYVCACMCEDYKLMWESSSIMLQLIFGTRVSHWTNWPVTSCDPCASTTFPNTGAMDTPHATACESQGSKLRFPYLQSKWFTH